MIEKVIFIDYKKNYQEIREDLKKIFDHDFDYLHNPFHKESPQYLLDYKEIFKEEINSQEELKIKIKKLIDTYFKQNSYWYKLNKIVINNSLKKEVVYIEIKIEEIK